MTPPPVTLLPEVDSTNTYMAAHAGEMAHGHAVRAVAQTAGRGQRGNHWEAEPGLNLTFSLMLHPRGIDAAAQFVISQAVALGVARVAARHLPSAEITVKWPNDIYAGDRKLCGILIENVIAGRSIVRSIAGIGLNVNQKIFRSDAPNPVSMAQIAGHTFGLPTLLDEIVAEILALLSTPADLGAEYASRLWRRTGVHPFIDHTRADLPMMASITSVAPSGIITLTDTAGTARHYAFKEISFVI